jgi:HigB_toxin, RelE-like toxic component of a toxin-antitoxin system
MSYLVSMPTAWLVSGALDARRQTGPDLGSRRRRGTLPLNARNFLDAIMGIADGHIANDYRLVAINYRHRIVFIKWIGTHGDYDKIDVKT